MRKQLKSILTLMVAALSFAALGQDEDRKIKIEITKDINGEKKTFKGEYNSTEEMRADPNYQEFAGEEGVSNFWFGSGDDDIAIHLDQLKNNSNTFFKFFDQEDEDGSNFFFHNFDGEDSDTFDFHFGDSEELQEKLEELGIELDVLSNRLHDDGKRHSMSVIVMKKVSVSDVDNEFGKKGKVDEDEQLELDDLTFYPNPAPNGQLKVRFTAPSEDELTIRVSNLEGKEVFSRYFESFSGTYSERIDLSSQKEGIYLLEIMQGKKRLTKKIVIN